MAVSTMKLYAIEDAMVRSGAPDTVYHNNASISMPYASQRENSSYYFRPDLTLGDAIRKHILGYQPYIYVTNKRMTESGWSAYEYYIVARQAFASTLEALTYNNQENIVTEEFGTSYGSKTTPYSEVPTGSYWTPCDIIPFDASQNICKIEERFNHEGLTFQGVAGANKPYLLLSMEDAELTIRHTPATGAYLNRHAAAKLTWALATNAYGGPTAFTQASATVSWRNGASGAVNSVDVDGGEMAVVIPADTFPSTAALQWKVAITFASGETAESDWATLTTIDSISSCALVSPVSTFIDGSVVNRFTWDHIIATGTAQSKYDLQCSTNDGASWTNIASAVESENQYCDVPADTLPAGTVLWRVRTYNADGVEGAWSDSATIIVQAAPAAPPITSVTSTPRPDITWQSSGQQAYQVMAGNYDSGAVFGTTKTHKIPLFLPDGSASIRVRIQNEFGLWSAWSVSDIIVTNAGSGTVALSAMVDANTNVRLTWQATGEGIWYYIYRDGALIGRTGETTFTDHLAIGLCSYTVRAVAGDDYILSAPVTVDVACDTAVIADIDTFDWSELPHLRDSEPVIKASATRQVTYQHYSGRRFPLAEIAEYEDETYSFEYSFLDRAEAMAVRELLGKIVAVKTAHDECYVGVLEAMPYSTDWAATDVAFTVRAVDYKDVIEYEI